MKTDPRLIDALNRAGRAPPTTYTPVGGGRFVRPTVRLKNGREIPYVLRYRPLDRDSRNAPKASVRGSRRRCREREDAWLDRLRPLIDRFIGIENPNRFIGPETTTHV